MQSALSQHFKASRFAQLSGFAGFVAKGQDVQTFLQGQLTNDVKALTNSHWQRTGYCTPKGRLLANFLQWQTGPQSIGQVVPHEIFEPVVKRLRMFVLRSNVTFENVETPLSVFGLWGEPQGEFGNAQQYVNLSGTEHGPWLLSEHECPVLGKRAWLIVESSQLTQALEAVAGCAELAQSAWLFSEIQTAQAWIWKATQEAFVPQMINFEITGGVSFTKGCYPGQEVVARSQYLGKLKRRSFRADLDSAVSEAQVLAMHGQDIWAKGNDNEPCGKVVGAAPKFNSQGLVETGAALLIECTIEAWEKGSLHLESPQGPALIAKALPYAFPATE
jgi:tRNA-modifying protein YgfZ